MTYQSIFKSALLGTALALTATPAYAQEAPEPLPGEPSLAARPPVAEFTVAKPIVSQAVIAAFYDTFQPGIVFLDRPDFDVGVTRMLDVLDRSVVEGLEEGPRLAATIRRELEIGIPTEPEQRAALDRLISRAWMSYMATIKAPVPGMLYGDDWVKPKGTQPHEILLTAKAVPDLAQHVADMSNVNYFYDRIRDAEWKRLGERPGAQPDPRVVANLSRARAMPRKGRYVIVDSASQTLWMVENGQPVDSMKVVVGKVSYATPMIASLIHYATFNPYWHVPDHLARGYLADGMLREGKRYAERNGYEMIDSWSYEAEVLDPMSIDWKAVKAGRAKVQARQLPSSINSMGKIKFDFPNPEGIYLHDTPKKEYFDLAARDLSNGCIRLEDAMRLGRWLLREEPVAPNADPEQFVPLPVGTAVYVTYLTATVDEGGQLAFLDDIYSWDPVSGGAQQAQGQR